MLEKNQITIYQTIQGFLQLYTNHLNDHLEHQAHLQKERLIKFCNNDKEKIRITSILLAERIQKLGKLEQENVLAQLKKLQENEFPYLEEYQSFHGEIIWKKSVSSASLKNIRKKIKDLEEELSYFRLIEDNKKHKFDLEREKELCARLAECYVDYISIRKSLDKPVHSLLTKRLINYRQRSADIDLWLSKMNFHQVNCPKVAINHFSRSRLINTKSYIKLLTSSVFKKQSSDLTKENPQFQQILTSFSRKQRFLFLTKEVEYFQPDQLFNAVFDFTDKMFARERALFPDKKLGFSDKPVIFGEKLLLLLRQISDKELIKTYQYLCGKQCQNFINTAEFYRSNPDFILKNDSRFSENALSNAKSSAMHTLISYVDSIREKMEVVLRERNLSIFDTADKDISEEQILEKDKNYLFNFAGDFIAKHIKPISQQAKMNS